MSQPIYLTDDAELAKLNMYISQDIPDVCQEVDSALKDIKAKLVLFGLDFDMFDTSGEDDEYFAQLSQYAGLKRNSITGEIVQVDKIAENYRDSLFLHFSWEPNEAGLFTVNAEVIRGADVQALIDADELDSIAESQSEPLKLNEGGSYLTLGFIKDMKVSGVHTWSGAADVNNFEGKKMSSILKKYPKASVQIEIDKGNNEVVINLNDEEESFVAFDLKKSLTRGDDYIPTNARNEPTEILREDLEIMDELSEAISKEARAAEAAVGKKVKEYFKTQNIPVRVRLIPSQRENAWLQVWRADDTTIIPNELRKKGVELVYGSTKDVRDVNDIDFGNFNARGMSMQINTWKKLIGLTNEDLESGYFPENLTDFIEARLAMKPGKGNEDIETGVQAGFDLTDIRPEKFTGLLDMFGMKPDDVTRDDSKAFNWKSKDLLIVTANNPITGEYYNGQRGTEVGYASYIGLEGTEEAVKKAYKYISKYGDYKDRNPSRREYI